MSSNLNVVNVFKITYDSVWLKTTLLYNWFASSEKINLEEVSLFRLTEKYL